MEKRTIRHKTHVVYETLDEFREVYAIEKVRDDWRLAFEGDWVYSDDGRIVQLLKVKHTIKHPNDRKNYKYAGGWVRTVVGTFLIKDDTIMDTDFSKHRNRYTFSGKKPTSISKRKNITRKEKIFATNIVVGAGPVKSYMDAFNEDDESNARKKAVVLLKQERVMSEIEKSVMDIAKTMGIDHEYILNKLKCLVDNSQDDNIILQSTKELGKIIGTTGTTVKQRDMGIIGMFKGFSQGELESAQRPQLEEPKE